MNIPSWVPHWSPSVASGWATCHFAIAWAAMFTGVHFGLSPQITLALFVFGFATPKEFFYDLVVERDTVFGTDPAGSYEGSAVDWAWYFIGSALATILIVGARHDLGI
jgi:hypothetical protein